MDVLFNTLQYRAVRRRHAGALAIFTLPELQLECNFPALAGALK